MSSTAVPRPPIWLLGLVLAALLFATDDYIIAGVLPSLAQDLGVSEAAAGQLITVYALTIAASAAPTAWLLRDHPPHLVICGALGVFVAANVAASFADSYPALFLLRVVAGAAAGAAVPRLLATAARLAPAAKRGTYIAAVSLGLAAAVTVGVPLGTAVAALSGWRGTFAVMAGLGAVAMIALAASLPRGATGFPVTTPADPPGRSRATMALILALATSAVVVMSEMLLVSYLVPYVDAVSSAGGMSHAALFAVAGGAGLAALWAGGAATDRWGASTVLTLSVSGLVAVMLTMSTMWLARPVNLVAVGAAAMAWGFVSFGATPALHARFYRLAGERVTALSGLNTSLGYLALAAAAGLGGLVLGLAGPQWLAPTSAAIAMLGLVLHLVSMTADRAASDPVDQPLEGAPSSAATASR